MAVIESKKVAVIIVIGTPLPCGSAKQRPKPSPKFDFRLFSDTLTCNEDHPVHCLPFIISAHCVRLLLAMNEITGCCFDGNVCRRLARLLSA